MSKVIGVNLLILVIGLAICELLFGSWFDEHNYGFLNLPRNVRITSDVSHLYAGGGTVTYTRDRHGLRGDYGAPEDIDMLVLGGSTTNELYIDDCCTWPALVSELAAKNGKRLRIANAGIDGQSSVGHIWNFEAWFPNIPGLRPKWVLVYLGVNEGNAEVEVRTDKGLPQYKDAPRRIKQFIKNNSALFNLYSTVRGTIEARSKNLKHGQLDFDAAEWEEMSLSQFQALECDTDMERSFAARLTMLTERIRTAGALPILATQRRGDAYISGDMIRGVASTRGLEQARRLRCLNRRMLAFCREHDVDCIDVANTARLTQRDFYDAIHTTPSGSARVAEAVYRGLAPLL